MKRFVYFFCFTGWGEFSLGFHVDVISPNVEVHVPFGFFKVGWQTVRATPSVTFGQTYRHLLGGQVR
jgi:hypothetical protein